MSYVKAKIYYADDHQEFYNGEKSAMPTPGCAKSFVAEYLGNKSEIVVSTEIIEERDMFGNII